VESLKAILAEMQRLRQADNLLGVSNQNAQLHRRLLEIAGHETASRLIATLNSQIVRFQYRTILLPGRSERSAAEHAAIVDAIAIGDADAAEDAMRTHLSHIADALRGSQPS
jgi:DNA-binding GntR family transcriptional regulator